MKFSKVLLYMSQCSRQCDVSLEIKLGIQMWFHCGNSVLPLQAMQANQYFEGDQGRVIDGPAVDTSKQNDQSLEEEDDEEEDNDNENVIILAHFQQP